MALATPQIVSADQIEDANKLIDAQDDVIVTQRQVIDLQKEQISHLSIGLDSSLAALKAEREDSNRWYRDPIKVGGVAIIAYELVKFGILTLGVKK
jgi:hypothetical protein